VGKLLDTIAQFDNSDAQKKAVLWLQNSTGSERYARFIQLWRQGVPGARLLMLVNVWEQLSKHGVLPHQSEALNWLESGTHARTMAEFLRQYGQPRVIKLAVPYYSQRDNLEEAHRTCNTSSHSMLVSFLKPGTIAGDDDYYQRFVKGQFDSTDWEGHTRTLWKLGIKSEFRTDLTYKDLDRSLEAGYPVVIGVLHKGSLKYPTGGHVIICIGRDANRTRYICHDPWGVGFETYSNTNGEAVFYPRSSLDTRWVPGAGYGRIVLSVDGRTTGL
jgi:hypothetical protein